MKKQLSNSEKIIIISNTPEVQAAIKLLHAGFKNMKLASFIRVEFAFQEGKKTQNYELEFRKIAPIKQARKGK